jgi:hypothetical protein
MVAAATGTGAIIFCKTFVVAIAVQPFAAIAVTL